VIKPPEFYICKENILFQQLQNKIGDIYDRRDLNYIHLLMGFVSCSVMLISLPFA